ncbi:formate dehydrogenase accessory protein FdhE [Neobacillus mesonae]|uniref:Formate dehydrogenase n=1 Tax=Neobacillus mesonae TaxID=1193713 RepID=A0A3Q9QYS5_9BACI|nr:formate dehydrogenase accessory protein FdhE [Neobacillus mesonae]AZU64655.1 formate dehydrogenase [Neobacillus mesonae]
MDKSVVTKNYMTIQRQIFALQDKWKKMMDPNDIKIELTREMMAEGIPAIESAEIAFDLPLYLQLITEISTILINNKPDLKFMLEKMSGQLDADTAQKWIEHALSWDYRYFNDFAQEHGIDDWIPYFIAETALRPYIQAAAEKVQHQLHPVIPDSACPVCCEPIRLATLEEDGKKVIRCPRCHAHWPARRLKCSLCGCSDHTKLDYLTIEGDAISQIQVCNECRGYIKIVDIRQLIEKPSTSLLDLLSLHLDLVAQENGYYPDSAKIEQYIN